MTRNSISIAKTGLVSAFLALAASTAIAADGVAVKVGPDTAQEEISVAKHQAAIDLLPEDVAKSGTLSVGLEANGGYPNSVTTDSAFYGLTYDLAKEIAATLGLELKLNTGPFPTLLPGLQAKRFQFSTSLYGDSEERRKAVDFVYATLGLGEVLLAAKKSPEQALTFDNVCGLTIGTTAGSAQQARLETASAKCEADGKEAVNIQQFPSNPETVLSAVSNRVDGIVLHFGGAGYAAKANPDRLALGPVDMTIQRYSGIALPKDSPLKPAIQAAMVNLINTGVWKQTLTIYGQEATLPDVSVVEKGEPYAGQ